ncbi:MAG: UDP-N-acetylglucosamine pyrophosphorylase, partial [Candidatus Weimeria sp.]|nr:UDP-N-acetylglucosamine pyrophosphorylase [Candidatus Weimeria sp.]
MECTIANMYDLRETIAAGLFEGKTYPWEVLPEIGDYIMELGKTLDPEVFEKRGEDIWVAKDVKIYPTATLTGPLIIDEGTEIRPGAFIRGKAIIGKNCVIGNSTEIKNDIIFNNVQVPHYNYVGDSVLGFHSHMGAGSITSNVKSDKTLVVVKDRNGEEIETGYKKFGAMLGDYVEVGC